MAASFHQGFSDHPAEFDIEVGHYLGLRWFHLSSGPDPAWKPPAATAIRTQRLAVWWQLKDLADEAATANRAFSLTEQALWDGLNAQLDAFDARLAGPQVPRLSGARDAWRPGENVARCLTYDDSWRDSSGRPHVVPADRCGCGFWAYWALGKKQVQSPAVAGIIKGYGEVIEGELGFRCSHAKIIALFPLVYSTELALNLEDSYEADVYHSFQAMLEMNPAPAGQPPLTDAYFSRQGEEPPAVSWAAEPTGLHSALKRGLGQCPKCATLACAPGQKQCVACDVSDLAHTDTVRKILKPKA
jgi:hypothetical protein